jgi:hypothetical protein
LPARRGGKQIDPRARYEKAARNARPQPDELGRSLPPSDKKRQIHELILVDELIPKL